FPIDMHPNVGSLGCLGGTSCAEVGCAVVRTRSVELMAALEHWLPIMFEDTSQILDIAREAEAAGFTGVALADHVAIPVGFRSVHPSGDNPFTPTSEFVDPIATAGAI